MRLLLWLCLLAGVALSLSLSYDVATQEILVGSIAGRWFYPYLASFSLYTVFIAAVATALCAGPLYVSDVMDRRGEWSVVVMWCVAALAIQGLICSLAPYRFGAIFASDGANSFNSVAQRFTPATILGDFEAVRHYWPPHGQSNMPGKALLVSGLRHISKRVDVLPWLVLAVSNLGGVFLYGLVKDLLNDRRTALYALILYLVVPGKMFFFPLLNVVTPVATLLSAWLLVRFLRTSHLAYALLFGASLYLLVLWEPIGLVIGVLFAGWLVAAWIRGPIRMNAVAWGGVAVVAAFGLAYWAMAVRFHFQMLPIVRLLTADAVRFNVDTHRPYDIWMRQNLRDFLFAVGLCPAVLCIGALVDGIVQGRGGLGRLSEPIVVVVLGVLATVIATDLSGINRGEVVRLWIFLACFAQIPAAYVCGRLQKRWVFLLVLAVTLLHDALGVDMIGFILPG
jgi:hypothetical protein